MNIFGSSNYHRKLELYQREHPAAKTIGASECQRSGCCCWIRPPMLTHDDLTRLAKHFGVTEREFFKQHCVVDETGGRDPGPVLIRSHQEQYSGEYLPASETWSIESPCAFLDVENNNACKLHDVKPTECSRHKCWDPAKGFLEIKWTRDELIGLGWDGAEEDWDD